MPGKTNPIKFHGIEIIEKVMSKTQADSDTEFNYDISVQTIINHEKKFILEFVKANIKGNNTREILATITIACGFLTDDFDAVFFKNGVPVKEINPGLERALRMISISTLRGIIFSEFRGTKLHSAILPDIDPESMLPANTNIF